MSSVQHASGRKSDTHAAIGTSSSEGSGRDSGLASAGRVGPVDPQTSTLVSRVVLLMWAAACGDRECPVLQWLGQAVAGGPPIVVGSIER